MARPEIQYNEIGGWKEWPAILTAENIRAYLRRYYSERDWSDAPRTLELEYAGVLVCVYQVGSKRLEAMFGQGAFEKFVTERELQERHAGQLDLKFPNGNMAAEEAHHA